MRVNRSARGRGAHATSAAFSTPACGGGEIRTHGELAPTAVFKTAAFDRSATPPELGNADKHRPLITVCGSAEIRLMPTLMPAPIHPRAILSNVDARLDTGSARSA